jgi:hypothetical protein
VSEDWKEKWRPAVAAVGKEFSDGTIVWGADRVEPGSLRRLVEPLEINTLIHTDEDAARAAGYDGLVSPMVGVFVYSIPATWSPGEPELFVDESRDGQPARSPIDNSDLAPAPETKGFFATEFDVDLLRPVEVGELLGRRGRKLLSCTLRETSVGRGAFMTWESEIVSDRGDTVARLRAGSFAFDPDPRDEHGESAS